MQEKPVFFVSNVREDNFGRVLSRLDKETTGGHQVHICLLRKLVIRSKNLSSIAIQEKSLEGLSRIAVIGKGCENLPLSLLPYTAIVIRI